jgi:hypothetical protein
MSSTEAIWKFPMPVQDIVEIALPTGARILTVQAQGPDKSLVLWAIVCPDAPLETRRFAVIGTGYLYPQLTYLQYVATVQQHVFVWHVFETSQHEDARHA